MGQACIDETKKERRESVGRNLLDGAAMLAVLVVRRAPKIWRKWSAVGGIGGGVRRLT